jgi:peptidoglycan/xylan/chitin deacetylase (PgdA/CDA1 family)
MESADRPLVVHPISERRNLLRQSARMVLAALLPRGRLLVNGSRSIPMCCLTFDDGPDPRYTPQLLDVLSELGIRGTFFLIGEAAQRHPALVQRIAGEGHTVGNHTWSHSLPSQISTRQFEDEILRTRDLLGHLTDRSICWLRPPLGKLTLGKLRVIWRTGHIRALWSVDPKDYQCSSVAELIKRIEQMSLRGGDVLLMHDNRPFVTDGVKAWMAMATEKRLTFVTLDEMIAKSSSVSQGASGQK